MEKIIILCDPSKDMTGIVLFGVSLANVYELHFEIVFLEDEESKGSFTDCSFFKAMEATVELCRYFQYFEDGNINLIPEKTLFYSEEVLRKNACIFVGDHNNLSRFNEKLRRRNIPLDITKQVCWHKPTIKSDNSRILFIADYNESDHSLMKFWSVYCNFFEEAEFHFIFISEDACNLEHEEIYNKLFEDGIPDISFQLTMIQKVNSGKEIEKYIIKNEITQQISLDFDVIPLPKLK